jgi:hypothetical protein
MDTEEFLVLAEEIAKEHPDDEVSVQFLKACNAIIMNERECMICAGQVMVKFAS